MHTLLLWVRSPFPAGWSRWYAIPLRLVVGFGFMQHGYAKFARGSDYFAGILLALGLPAPDFLAWLTIIVELIGGLAVLLGAFIPLAAIPMAAILIVATTTVHWQNGFSSIKLLAVDASGAHFGQPGYEADLLYLAALVTLVIGGPGPMVLDTALSFRKTSVRWPREKARVESGAISTPVVASDAG